MAAPSIKSRRNPLQVGDMCVCLEDDWEELANLRVRSIGDEILLGPYVDVMNTEPARSIPQNQYQLLFVSPYSLKFRRAHQDVTNLALYIRDLASSYLRAQSKINVQELVRQIKTNKGFENVDAIFIEGCLKCCVASSVFVPKSDKRTKNKEVSLELSAEQREVESRRVFAGTLAGELSSYSERIRHLVQHTSTVGTYRENLLQTLLRKHIPERYHVATGFIYGCQRQIDVIIYDRIDYAPVFREGDLVVVPPQSVRAVIEVKTNLTKVQLRASLQQVGEVSPLDDCSPPFFKGIFGFESDLDANNLLDEVVNFYIDEHDFDTDLEELELNQINSAYHHLTSVCVLGHVFGQVKYERDKSSGQLRPALFSLSSATGLDTQASHFLEILLSYLRFGGLKPPELHTISEMLGADTQMTRVGKLVAGDWGVYFALENDIPGYSIKDVEYAEKAIAATEAWIEGSAWMPPRKSK